MSEMAYERANRRIAEIFSTMSEELQPYVVRTRIGRQVLALGADIADRFGLPSPRRIEPFEIPEMRLSTDQQILNACNSVFEASKKICQPSGTTIPRWTLECERLTRELFALQKLLDAKAK